MPITSADQQRIIANESAWVDTAFGGLDLSQFPDLNSLPPESKHDDRFARDWRDTPFSASADALRNFVANPDIDAMEETGSGDLLRDVRDRRAEEVVREFKRACPEYLPTHENYHSMVVTLAFNALPESERNADDDDLVDLLVERGYWTPGNLEAVYRALDDQGILDRPAGEPRNLNERERLRVARMAQAGRVDEAIGEYLRCALDGDEPTMELVNDPKYRGLCDDAVLTVFEETQLDYVPTAARKAYLLRFAGNRPLTIPLLQQAWKSCQQNESRSERSALLNQMERPEPQPVTAQQIDELSDGAVDALYHDSLRAYAESIRRAPGVLA